MSSTQSFTSRAYHGYSSEYDHGSAVLVDYDSASVFSVTLYSTTENSWVTMNSTGKNKLFPNSTARPIKADITFWADWFGLSSSNEARLYIGGAQLFNQKCSAHKTSYSFTNRTDGIITNSNKSTEIKWELAHGSMTGFSIDQVAITYYFTRYDFSASAGTGITQAAALSKSLVSGAVSGNTGGYSPYYNGQITYTTLDGSKCVAITNNPSNGLPDGAIIDGAALTVGQRYLYKVDYNAPAGKKLRIGMRLSNGGNTENVIVTGNGGWQSAYHLFTATSDMLGSLEVVEDSDEGTSCTWYTRYVTIKSTIAQGYDGDQLGFYADVQDGYAFDGWYSGDTKISSSRYYLPNVSGADLSLTAKAHLLWDKSTTCTVKYNNQILTQFSANIPIAVNYDGAIIHNIGAIRSAELLCKDLYMRTNVRVGQKTLECYGTKPTTNISVSSMRSYPAGYTPLLCLVATGSQEIITDWTANDNTNYEIWYDASYDAAQPNDRGLQGWNTHAANYWGVNAGRYELPWAYAGTPGVRSKIRWIYPTTGNQSLIVDGTRILSIGRSQITTGDSHLKYFSLGGNSFMNGRLYGSYVLENGIMTHDYYPARRDSDNAVGLLDMMTGIFLVGAGMSGVAIENLVPPLSTWSWNGASTDGTTVYFPGGGLAMGTVSMPYPIPNHLYYGRVIEMRSPGSAGQISDARFEYYHSDTPGGLMIFSNMSNTPADGQQHMISAILSLPTVVQDTNWQIRCFVVSSGSAPNVNSRTQMMIIDLTATYGAGSEPTKEWLDENLPYIP